MMEQTQYDDGASAFGGGGFDSATVLRKLTEGINRKNSSIRPPTIKNKKEAPKRQNTTEHYRRTISSIQPDTIDEADEFENSNENVNSLARANTKLPIKHKLTSNFVPNKDRKRGQIDKDSARSEWVLIG